MVRLVYQTELFGALHLEYNQPLVRVGSSRDNDLVLLHHFQYEETPILEVAMMGRHDVWEAIVERERLLSHADHDPKSEFDTDRYAEVEDFILRNDGYALEARVGEILEGLGIPPRVHREPMRVLSGGFKLRVLLAQCLAADPDVLLLDEPTNHLDILTIRWLEKFLVAFPGCAIVISHDHRFLDNVATHILDVDYETILLYHGNYSRFAEAPAAAVAHVCDARHCPNDTNCGSAVSNAIDNGVVQFWADTPVQFGAGNLPQSTPQNTLGTPTRPISVAGTSDLKLTANITAYGMFFVATAKATADATYVGSGTAKIYGSFVSRGDFVKGAGTLDLIYDPIIFRAGESTGLLVRVPGSWRDKETPY